MASVNAKLDRYIVSDCSYSIKNCAKASGISFDIHMFEIMILLHTHKDFFLIKNRMSDVQNVSDSFRNKQFDTLFM